MRMIIGLLEGNEQRAAAMTAWLRDHFPKCVVQVWPDNLAMGQCLEDLAQEVVLVSLNPDQIVSHHLLDAFMAHALEQAVEKLFARRKPTFPVIFHAAGKATEHLASILHERGWKTARATPSSDQEGITPQWQSVVRGLLFPSASRQLRCRADEGFPFQVSKLIQRLIASPLPSRMEAAPKEEDALRRWLRRILRKSRWLAAYIHWLRVETGTIRFQGPLPQTADAIVNEGLANVDFSLLASLVLSPIALFHLHDRIREEKPAAWRSPRPGPEAATVLPLTLILGVAEARQKAAAADDASDCRRFTSDVWFTEEGRTYRGKVQWNCQQTSTRSECYLRLKFAGLQRCSLAGRLTTPKLIVRSPRGDGPRERSQPPWREVVPLTWKPRKGVLVSAWTLVPISPHQAVELEVSLAPSDNDFATSAGRTYEDDTHSDEPRGTRPLGRPPNPANGRPDRLCHHR